MKFLLATKINEYQEIDCYQSKKVVNIKKKFLIYKNYE